MRPNRTVESESVTGTATLEGTDRFRKRHAFRCNAHHFRKTSDLILSSIGLGTARGEVDDIVDGQIAKATVRSISGGINVIDTAANYREGRSERAVGIGIKAAIELAKAHRDELFIASKGGYMPFSSESPHYLASYLKSIDCAETIPDVVRGCHSIHPKFLAHELRSSCKNIGLETLDLYYLHNPEVQLCEVQRPEFQMRLLRAFVFLEEMCCVGVIRRYGIATWHGLRVGPKHRLRLNLEEIYLIAQEASVNGRSHFAFIQAPLNPLMPELVSTTQSIRGQQVSAIEAAQQLGLSLIGSCAVAQGLPLNSVRSALGPAFRRSGETDAQQSIQFSRGVPYVSSCLAGMKTEDHIAEVLAMTCRPPLSPEEFLNSLSSSQFAMESRD